MFSIRNLAAPIAAALALAAVLAVFAVLQVRAQDSPRVTLASHTATLADGTLATLTFPAAPLAAGDPATFNIALQVPEGVTLTWAKMSLYSSREGHGADLVPLRHPVAQRTAFDPAAGGQLQLDPLTVTETQAPGIHALRVAVWTSSDQAGAVFQNVQFKIAGRDGNEAHILMNPAQVVSVQARYRTGEWVFTVVGGSQFTLRMTENERLRGDHHRNADDSTHWGKGWVLLSRS